jgi:hypothetical protein
MAEFRKLFPIAFVFILSFFFLRGENQDYYLDNGIIRVGVDISRGGAIDYLAESSNPQKNYINRFDAGRLVQRSCFGPPFIYNACPGFPNWPWNPVQGGDCFNNGSPTIEIINTENYIYTKCVPLNWGSNNELTDSFIETWISLEGRAVRIESRFTNGSENHARWMDQEVLAVYVNTELNNLWYYGGNSPFTWDELTVLYPPSKNTYFQATEYWSAWLDDNQFGVGVFSQDVMHFTAFRVGKQGIEDDYAFETNYVGVIPRFSVPPYATHHAVSYLILDNLPNIRRFVYSKAQYPSGYPININERGWGLMAWEFNELHNREGWSVGWDYKQRRNSLDDSFGVINGIWSLFAQSSAGLGSYIISPQFQVPAKFYNLIELRLRIEKTDLNRIFLYWNRLRDKIFAFYDKNSTWLDVLADGEWHIYFIDLKKHPNWRGTIRQLCFAGLGNGNLIEIDYIRVWMIPKRERILPSEEIIKKKF